MWRSTCGPWVSRNCRIRILASVWGSWCCDKVMISFGVNEPATSCIIENKTFGPWRFRWLKVNLPNLTTKVTGIFQTQQFPFRVYQIDGYPSSPLQSAVGNSAAVLAASQKSWSFTGFMVFFEKNEIDLGEISEIFIGRFFDEKSPWDGSGWPGGCGGWSDPVSNKGGGVKERSSKGLTRSVLPTTFCDMLEAVLLNSCLLMFLCVYLCLLLNLSETFRGVLSFYFVTSHQE